MAAVMVSALAAFPLRVRGLHLVTRLVGRLLHIVLIFIAIEEDLLLVVSSFLLFLIVTERYFPSLSLPADTLFLYKTSSCSLHVWLRVSAAASANISTVPAAVVCLSSSHLITALYLTFRRHIIDHNHSTPLRSVPTARVQLGASLRLALPGHSLQNP